MSQFTANIPKASRGSVSATVRRLWSKALGKAEPIIELIIRLCGWSAILFVVALFIFVFWEGAGARGHLKLW
jgi:hypothetical protein